MIAELEDLLVMHDDPTTYSGEVVEHIVDLIPRHGLDLILSQLPEVWSQALVSWIVAAYDNIDSQGELIYINNPNGPQQMAHIKEWMTRNPEFRSRAISDVQKLIQMKQERLFSKHQLMDQLVRVSADQGVDTVVRQLPESVKATFIEWARDRFLHDGAPLRHPGEKQVREWLSRSES